MADMNVSRLGQANQAGDAWNLFLKKFGGEVLTAYEDANITDGKVMERNIDSGKSAQFPAIGKIGAGYHTPGQQIMGRITRSSSLWTASSSRMRSSPISMR